jgi:xanthine dehydrogenase large subunit
MNRSAPHESAHLHVQGLATYIDDLPLTEGTLHAAPILSTVASGVIESLDTSAALKADGVRAVVTTDDIPGDRLLSTFVHDEPVFAHQRVDHLGQVLGLVVADSHIQARADARNNVLKVRTEPVLLNARESAAQEATVLPSVRVQRGNAARAMEDAPHQLSGQLDIGGQEHYYLETQIAYAIPQDNGEWLIHSSTQHPGEAQHWVAHALDVPLHRVRSKRSFTDPAQKSQLLLRHLRERGHASQNDPRTKMRRQQSSRENHIGVKSGTGCK